MSATYAVRVYSPLQSVVIHRTDANDQTIHSYDPALTIIPSAGWFSISNIIPSTQLVDVMIIAKRTSDGVTIRQWRASTTSGRIEVAQAQSYSVTIEIRYDHYVPPTTTFIIRADYSCGGVHIRSTSGNYYDIDNHGGVLTITTTDDLLVYNVRDLNGETVELSKCYAVDIRYSFTKWKLSSDQYINAIPEGGTREILIKVKGHIPLFHWEDTYELDNILIVPGAVVSSHITAYRWNLFVDNVYEICQFCEIDWTKNTVSSGDTITASILNHVIAALNSLPDVTFNIPLVASGDTLTASLFVGVYSLKAALNQEINYINQHG